MKKALLHLGLLLALLTFISIRPLMVDRSLGSRHAPIVITLTPSVDAQKVSLSADKLAEYLHAKTGYHFSVTVPSSFIAVVEALGSGKADIAAMNTFGYVLANSRYGATAVLKIIRGNNELTYKGQIITRADSGIDSLYELNGKRIAYVDPASTSGYILPRALFQSLSVKPSEEVFAMKHDNVVTMVYQGQVDAGATYYSPPDASGAIKDARERVKAQFPDVEQKVRIIGFTPDIPNDPFVVRKGFPQEMTKAITAALLDFTATPEGKAALNEIYSVEGLAPATDSDYDVLRRMLASLNIDVSGALQKKK